LGKGRAFVEQRVAKQVMSMLRKRNRAAVRFLRVLFHLCFSSVVKETLKYFLSRKAGIPLVDFPAVPGFAGTAGLNHARIWCRESGI
jgi:hypothetical protein